MPRPFRFEFPKVTHARAGNVQIHRRPCILDARSDLERCKEYTSKYRKLATETLRRKRRQQDEQ